MHRSGLCGNDRVDEEGLELMTHGDNDIFGKWAWATRRNMRNPPTSEHEVEEDTDEEAAAYDSLERHVDKNIGIDAEDASNIMTALQSKKYSDVLKPPQTSHVYRGMSVPKSWLLRALKIKLEDEDNLPDVGEVEASFTFMPFSNESSSWSTSDVMADEYARKPGSSGYGVVLTAPVDQKTMISGPDGFYKVSGLDPYYDEDEVICFGPVHVSYVSWRRQGKKIT